MHLIARTVSLRPLGLVALTTALALGGCSRQASPDLDDTIARARRLLDQEREAEAVDHLNKALKQGLAHADIYYQRALAQERLGQTQEAWDDYSAALESAPQFSDARNNRGVLAVKRGDYEAAIADFSEVLAVDSDFILAYKNRGLAYHDQKRYDEALEDFNAAIERRPDAEAFFLRGNVHLEQQQYDQAIADYDLSIQRDDKFARVWLNRGVAMLRSGKVEEGKQNLRKAAAVDSDTLAPELLAALELAAEAGVRQVAAKPIVEPAPQQGLAPTQPSKEQVAAYLAEQGWQLATRSLKNKELWITSGEQQRQLLLVRVAEGETRWLAERQSVAKLLESQTPLSLLVAVGGDAKPKWHFTPQWAPKTEDFQVALLAIKPPATKQKP